MLVRREVLNMPSKMWDRLDNEYGTTPEFNTTPSMFLLNVGLPGALSAKLNSEEKQFFDQIYKIDEMIKMDPDNPDNPEKPIFDKTYTRKCLSYYKGCKNFDNESMTVDKPCASLSFGILAIKCGNFEAGKPPVLNTPTENNTLVTKAKEATKMSKKMTKEQKEAKKNAVQTEEPTVETQEPVVTEPKVTPEPEVVKETKKSKPAKEPKAPKEPKAEKVPKGEGAVAKIEAMIVQILKDTPEGMDSKTMVGKCPAEFNAATWQVRIYHLRKAGTVAYNKKTKILTLAQV
jgi:hypothetical protein